MHITICLKQNKLSLNIKKTLHYIPRTQKRYLNVSLLIDGKPTDDVDQTKFISALTHHKLTLKQHIGKIARGIGMASKQTVSKQTRVDIILFFFHLSVSQLL